MKFPWMQWFATDWLNDPQVSACEPATRGILMDWLCNMHLLDRSGQITGTREQLSRLGRCTAVQVESALLELIRTKAADVTERYGVVTVVNRRMKREAKERNSTKLRMQKMRSHCSVTPYARARASDLSLKSVVNSQNQKLKSDKGDGKAFAKLNPRQKEAADRFERALNGQWVNDSGKWVNRIRDDINKCERVVAEIESAARESRINTTPAQYAEQVWKEFA